METNMEVELAELASTIPFEPTSSEVMKALIKAYNLGKGEGDDTGFAAGYKSGYKAGIKDGLADPEYAAKY